MKHTLLIITALMLVVGFSDAQTYKGMRFNDDGSKSFETYKESKGKLDLVKQVSWYSNGQKEAEGTFKNGELNGKWTYWAENGQKIYEQTWKDGKLVRGGSSEKEPINEPTLIDIDGNSYMTVKIGNQIWMAENLKVTHYRNGDIIPTGHSDSDWLNLSTGAYAVYDGFNSNAETYGYLYNWYAVDDERGLAPEGWHIPTSEEWSELEDYLGENAGGKLRSFGTIANGNGLWKGSNYRATNESGFTALPGGYRDGGHNSPFGSYDDLGDRGYFWSSEETEGRYGRNRILATSNENVLRYAHLMNSGFSVHCVKD